MTHDIECTPQPDDDRQRVNWLTAAASKRGINILRTPRGYVVFQWGLSRHCDTIDSLACLLQRMGVSLP